MGSPVQALALASLLITATYLYTKLREKRFKQYAHLPQLPNSLLWGHLKLFDEYTKRGKADRHPDSMIVEMHKDLGSPPLFIIDMRPINPPMVIVASYDVAEQISKPSKQFTYSVHKAPSVSRMVHLIGPHSILFHQDESWKQVRRRFNPGFAPNHLMTLLPCILDKVLPFLELLDCFAQTGEAFRLTDLTVNLTFDIIGAVAMDFDLEAQKGDASQQGDFIRVFKEMVSTYADDKLHLAWWLIPLTHLKRRRLGAAITEKLRDIVRAKFIELKSASADGGGRRSRTILALSLEDIDQLSPGILDETCDQLKTFLFAGHDTTSILLDWATYELSRTPRALKAVQAEVSSLFGADAHDPQAMRARLLAPGGDDLVRQMTYISAVIRECLRLHPPAGSMRMTMPEFGKTCIVSTPQGEYCLDGAWIYINHTIIHRDQAVYGDTADEFRPERWLGGGDRSGTSETSASTETGSYPTGAWRVFERGPRNCIGQELANIEARVIIAMLAHKYTFSKVGLGEPVLDGKGQPSLDDKGQYKAKSELYNTIQVTAKAVDGMVMKVAVAGTSH